MWQQMCKAEKVDAFDQILREMAIRYDPNSWRSLADVQDLETTEIKTKAKLRKGRQKVRKFYII